jgi:hypothetical protein
MRQTHTGIHHLRCRKCEFKAKTEPILMKHFVEVHNENKPFACDEPGCTFTAKKYDFLHKHLEIHT